MATTIRLYENETGEELRFLKREFNLADFGGHLPVVGDLIFCPKGFGSGGREIWEVLCRYHEPGVGFDAHCDVSVVIGRRPLTPSEAELLTGNRKKPVRMERTG